MQNKKIQEIPNKYLVTCIVSDDKKTQELVYYTTQQIEKAISYCVRQTNKNKKQVLRILKNRVPFFYVYYCPAVGCTVLRPVKKKDDVPLYRSETPRQTTQRHKKEKQRQERQRRERKSYKNDPVVRQSTIF